MQSEPEVRLRGGGLVGDWYAYFYFLILSIFVGRWLEFGLISFLFDIAWKAFVLLNAARGFVIVVARGNFGKGKRGKGLRICWFEEIEV